MRLETDWERIDEMAIEKKRMQQRYGTYDQFQAEKENLLPNEFASITSGDPNTSDGKGLYFGYGSGNVKRIAFSDEIDNGGGSGDGGGTGGTTNYNNLSNRPQINGITLTGNKTSSDLNLQPAGNYLTQETDPTVPAWAKEPTKPTYTASEVGALPVSTKIPTKTSDLTNDSGYLTQIPEEYVTETELGQKGYVIEDDIPEKLPNPQKIIFTGAVSAEYDGSSQQTINIPTGEGSGDYTLPIMSDTQLGGGKAVAKTNEDVPVAVDPETGQLYVPTYPESGETTVQQMQNTDTTVTLQPNILYLFPEMATLDVTIPATEQEIHFFFDSGATATAFSLQAQGGGQIYTDAYSIDANMRYEVSVLHNVAYIKGVSMSET